MSYYTEMNRHRFRRILQVCRTASVHNENKTKLKENQSNDTTTLALDITWKYSDGAFVLPVFEKQVFEPEIL